MKTIMFSIGILLIIALTACNLTTDDYKELPTTKDHKKEEKMEQKQKGPADFWDERFANDEYVYGKKPNEFFKESLEDLPKGRILCVGEGEGRNAVYAATKGWEVDAIDLSKEGKLKAENLAAENGVKVNYQVANALTFQTEEKYDAIAFIFLHLPKEIQKETYGRYAEMLKPGGKIILELYTPEQLGNTSGGPKNEEMLISKEDIIEFYPTLEMEYLEEVEVELNEGMHHQGKSNTVRMIAVKK